MPRLRTPTDAAPTTILERARRTAELIALCRSTSARASEVVLALGEARGRLDEAMHVRVARVRADGTPPVAAVAELRDALAAVDGDDPADFRLVCEELLARFAAALDAG